MATAPKPIPSPAVSMFDGAGRITQPWYEYMRGRESVGPGNVFGNPAGGNLGDNTINAEEVYDNGNRVLTVVGGQNLTGGFTEDEFDHGSPTNGSTITPNPSSGLKQKLTNNVAGFTLAATTEIGDCELRITNGASAGTITFSGFVQWPGDPLTTTNGDQFVIFIFGFGGGKRAYTIKKLQ